MSRRRGGPPSVGQAVLLLALVAVLVTAGGLAVAVGHPEWSWGLFGASTGCSVVAVAALGSRR